jgi:hypothetical protein
LIFFRHSARGNKIGVIKMLLLRLLEYLEFFCRVTANIESSGIRTDLLGILTLVLCGRKDFVEFVLDFAALVQGPVGILL